MKFLTLIVMLLFATYCKTASAIVLGCTFGNVSHALIGSRYTCTATVLFDEDDSLVLVFGDHETGRGHNDVQSLHINSQNLPFFPRNIEAFFPNIRALLLGDNSISNFSNIHINQFPYLELLSLHTNQITTLASNIFSGMTSLRYINFGSNKIKNIGHDINLADTASIYFSRNPCIDGYAETPAQVATLRLNLLRHCPPTIRQIEDTLESRPNLLTNLSYRNMQLEIRVAALERIVKDVHNKFGLIIEN